MPPVGDLDRVRQRIPHGLRIGGRTVPAHDLDSRMRPQPPGHHPGAAPGQHVDPGAGVGVDHHGGVVTENRGRALPSIGAFIDPPAGSLAALFRVALGGAAGWLLHTDISGMYAAVMVGASAPALLAQVGRAATPAEAIRARPGDDEPGRTASLPRTADVSPVSDEAAS
jgi:hypothetical protein